jgi:hypothetical protein
MMNHASGWMGGGGGSTWIWAIAALTVVLVVALITTRVSRR